MAAASSIGCRSSIGRGQVPLHRRACARTHTLLPARLLESPTRVHLCSVGSSKNDCIIPALKHVPQQAGSTAQSQHESTFLEAMLHSSNIRGGRVEGGTLRTLRKSWPATTNHKRFCPSHVAPVPFTFSLPSTRHLARDVPSQTHGQVARALPRQCSRAHTHTHNRTHLSL